MEQISPKKLRFQPFLLLVNIITEDLKKKKLEKATEKRRNVLETSFKTLILWHHAKFLAKKQKQNLIVLASLHAS